MLSTKLFLTVLGVCFVSVMLVSGLMFAAEKEGSHRREQAQEYCDHYAEDINQWARDHHAAMPCK